MYFIPQRLCKIFTLLFNAKGPVSVAMLASSLSVSKRTVFRELENVDAVLKKFNIKLDTSVGEGLYLSGTEQDISALIDVVNAQRESLAIDKELRRIALAMLLLDSTQWKKLYYFSSVLEVSEATVSLDLDALEDEFNAYNIQLMRKKGIGVHVTGQELNIRTAYVNYLTKAQVGTRLATTLEDILPTEIAQGVREILDQQSIFINWMTKDAILILSHRLIVQISRIKVGRTLEKSEVKKLNTLYAEVAKKLVLELEYRFDIEFIEEEVDYIVEGLRTARTKTGSEFYEDESIAFERAQRLAYRMIERFDNRLAPTLKTNEELVRGLSIHLWSAVIRIERGYKIKDPLGGQLKAEYPDVYRNTEYACSVLTEELERLVPEEEIACVATHFGAAILQIGQDRLKRRLRVGVICLGGIGVSYMMAGQVKKLFGKDVITEVCEYNQPYSYKDCDFLIATNNIPDTDKPVVIAHPMLSESEIKDVRRIIDKLAIQSQKVDNTTINRSFTEDLGIAIDYTKNIEHMLKNFEVVEVQNYISIDELARFSGYRFANNNRAGEKIYNSLLAREQMSTQLIEQLELVLLHCSTDGVKEPLLVVLHPQGGLITNDAGQKAKSCLLMLVPQNSSSEIKEAIGAVSSSLVEDEKFLRSVIDGDEKAITEKLEFIFSIQLTNYFRDHFGS